MDGAFFVSRGELLTWLNSLLSLDYSKVEQISSGAAMCAVFDLIYPGTISLKRVNFGAKTEYDFIK
jgi:RP/EB family microtubule-associated protein